MADYNPITTIDTMITDTIITDTIITDTMVTDTINNTMITDTINNTMINNTAINIDGIIESGYPIQRVNINPIYFNAIKTGSKVYEGRPGDEYRFIINKPIRIVRRNNDDTTGDTSIICIVEDVLWYESLTSAFDIYDPREKRNFHVNKIIDYKLCMPDASSREEVIMRYLAFDGYPERIKKFGFNFYKLSLL